MEQIRLRSEYNNSGCVIVMPPCDGLLAVGPLRYVLPGVDEVLGDADAGRRACDRNLAHG